MKPIISIVYTEISVLQTLDKILTTTYLIKINYTTIPPKVKRVIFRLTHGFIGGIIKG